MVINGKSIFEMSSMELKEVNNNLKMAYDLLARKSVMSLTPGTRVSFNTRRGLTESGNVIALNAKTVRVKTDSGTTWNVSASLLTKI